MGLLFYPRGGSAQVAGYLSRALVAQGCQVTLACGSLGAEGAHGNAATFFAGVDTVPAAYDDAVARWKRGEDPMDAPFPMHPSYEDREDAPDRAFSKVSPQQGGQMVAAWARLIGGSARLRRAEIFHLHHLTPLHEAVATALGGVPIVTHLHGTELKMLDAIARDQPGVGQGPHARWWAERMAEAARRADATIAISPHQRSEAVRLLGLDPATVHLLPDGVDAERFAVRRPSDDERRERWLDWLVRNPQGWDEESRLPGSIRYGAGRSHGSVLRRADRRAAPGPDVRRPLPRVQARAAARAGLRPCAGAHDRPGSARDLGRRAGRVGGRASAHRRHARRRRRHLLRRLARP